MSNVSHLSVAGGYSSLAEAFPDVDSGHEPLGHRVIVQIRVSKGKSAGGILLVKDTKDTEQWNTQVAKVVGIGPLAFHSRNTGTPWPEGAWVEAGDYVRVPKHGGDRWQVTVPGKSSGSDDVVLFAMFDDLHLLAKVKDPLAVIAFV